MEDWRKAIMNSKLRNLKNRKLEVDQARFAITTTTSSPCPDLNTGNTTELNIVTDTKVDTITPDINNTADTTNFNNELHIDEEADIDSVCVKRLHSTAMLIADTTNNATKTIETVDPHMSPGMPNTTNIKQMPKYTSTENRSTEIPKKFTIITTPVKEHSQEDNTIPKDDTANNQNKLKIGKMKNWRKEIMNSRPTYLKNLKPEFNQMKTAITNITEI